MSLKFNNKIPASERRGIIVLAFVIVISSIVISTCESGVFYNPVVIADSIPDSVTRQPEKDKCKSKDKSPKRKNIKTEKKRPAPNPRSPLDEPISIK